MTAFMWADLRISGGLRRIGVARRDGDPANEPHCCRWRGFEGFTLQGACRRRIRCRAPGAGTIPRRGTPGPPVDAARCPHRTPRLRRRAGIRAGARPPCARRTSCTSRRRRRWSMRCCGWPTSPRRTWSTTSARATDASRSPRRRRSARPGVGIELDPDLIKEANENAARAGVGDKVRFLNQDLFETDLRPATVITLYLLREMNLKLMPKLKATEARHADRGAQLRHGIRVAARQDRAGQREVDLLLGREVGAPSAPRARHWSNGRCLPFCILIKQTASFTIAAFHRSRRESA